MPMDAIHHALADHGLSKNSSFPEIYARPLTFLISVIHLNTGKPTLFDNSAYPIFFLDPFAFFVHG